MGKRKYEDVSNDGITKSELVEKDAQLQKQPQNHSSHKKSSRKVEKHDSFDIKHFRKELAGKQGQTIALTQFLQVCLNPDSDADYMLEYLKAGGNSHEILRQISQDNKKNLTLATPTFHLFHLIILKVQASLPHLMLVTEEACRYFLNTFMPTVEIMISENSGPKHRKIILKLLTSMVTLNPDLGVEVLNQAPLTPKHLQYIVEKVNYKEKDNVRIAFVHFMTSFLIEGHLPLIKALLEKQGLLALVIPGLIHDEVEAVIMFLSILKKNVIDNQMLSKSLKLKTFSHQVLHNIFKIFAWKGPSDINHESRNETRTEIAELLSNIVLVLFTSHKLGLYFVDNSLGTSDTNKNQNLYKALLTLKRPWENEMQSEVILEIVSRCPDLHRAIISVLEQSFEPQHSPIWERAVHFLMKLLDKLRPEVMVPRMAPLNPAQVANVVRFTTLPLPLLKFIQGNLGKEDQVISLHCAKILVKMLGVLKRYLHVLDNDNFARHVTELKYRLEIFCPKHLPAPSTVVILIQNIVNGIQNMDIPQDYSLPKPEDSNSLISLIDLLLLYHDIHPTSFEGLESSLDMKAILDYSKTLEEGNIAMLKFKIVSLWLTLDSSAISLKNPMFKELFLIMLEVYTNEDGDTWIEAKDTLEKIFKNTCIFEADEDEIHIMLYTLRNAKVNPISLVADIVEHVLANNKELTEYIRNQVVHFEITDGDSQTALDKLLDDLMNNTNTDDSSFLGNKVPSSFIVGSIQYMQTHKEAKKSLKHFLSLYIANLLHFNYSPEMTEVFIGDSKLDVRSYVASWIGEPLALNETIIAKDATLKKMSISLIEGTTMNLHEIFPFFEEASNEDNDFVFVDVPLKFNLAVIIDSSELFIWAKYLIFCLIRLAMMEQLQEMQQKKILQYIKAIMGICKECHLSYVSRSIIDNLLKNTHLLHIYTLIEDNKDDSKILVTNFLLDIIQHYSDILTHLTSRNKILQPFQQKNYNELIKTFIKFKKKKSVKSDHTVRVLEVIGMRPEDNLSVFKHIFELDVSLLIKDDKEPSIALDVLRVLLVKYIQSNDNDLPEDIFKQILKLYENILKSYEFNLNISALENALTEYLNMKADDAKHISIKDFKQFFHTNHLRKSTASLAATILKYNEDMCHILKEELDRPEILSQRELTLPLGNALIHHETFIEDNKELLDHIWKEYKSNIMKLLEKPNKAGPIYTSNWKFIRKLIIECSQIEDCIKIFGKNNKFEMLEITHVHLVQALFLRMCLFEEACKKEYLINYFTAMLNLITMAVKETKEDSTINEMVSHIYKTVRIAKTINGFELDKTDDFQILIESAVWQNFCKAVLKDSLKVKTNADSPNNIGPKLLSLLTCLVKTFYPSDHQDIVTLFDMVTSHSEFLNVMLSHHSTDIKSRLIELIYELILINKSVMKSQQIPVYLSSYHATRSPCDRLILSVLNFYETNDQPLHEYKPYVWGESAANYYAVRKNRSSLWAHPTPNQVMNLLEKDLIVKSIERFPVMQKLNYNYELPPNIDVINDDILLDGNVRNILEEITKDGLLEPATNKSNETIIKGMLLKAKYDKVLMRLRDTDLKTLSHEDGLEDESIYDPAFLFPLLSHLLVPGSVASCFKVLRSGLLSLPLMALSSHCPTMRAAAYHVLHRFCLLLDTETKHKNDKLLITDFIETLRNSLSSAIVSAQKEMGDTEEKNPRLPAVGALYLARALMISTAPFDPLYKPVNNFLIAKQHVDLTVVPDFLSLFHDSDVEATERRLWILGIIKDGTKTFTDVNVVFKTMCLKMIMDFYSSVLSDRKVKEKILNVLSAIVAIPRAAEILIQGYGLMPWIYYVVKNLRKDEKQLSRSVIVLLNNVLQSLSVNSFVKVIGVGKKYKKNGKLDEELGEFKVNDDIENKVLVMLNDLLLIYKDLESDDIDLYALTCKLLRSNGLKGNKKLQKNVKNYDKLM